ncbi:MAG: histidine kinase [Eubacterium sp.]|nr:histidine kinase [Eubacterium sp.]
MVHEIFVANSVNSITVAFTALLYLVGFFVSICIDNYIENKRKNVLITIFILLASLIVQNLLEDYLGSREEFSPLRVYVSAFGYIIRPLVIALFIFIVEYRAHIFVIAIIAFNTIVYASSPFTDIAFTITEENHFMGGPLRYTCMICSIILIAYLLIISLKTYDLKNKRDLVIPVFNIGIVVLGTYLDTNVGSQRQAVTFLTVAMTVSSVLYYRWISSQFVRMHEKDFAAEQRIKIMMTQIQPHFLYNTLSTIQALCLTNPEEAYSITGKFGKYLRRNIDSLEEPELIPFENELEHTRTYTDIEKIRFPDITVDYIVEDSDFSLPLLTVQPIVENSIRHGIRGVENGTVTVNVKKQPGCHIITVTDNGTGFDVASYSKSGTHIGMQNVKERIEKMCGGTLTVESEIGKGTTVTIIIPDTEKEGDGDEDNLR